MAATMSRLGAKTVFASAAANNNPKPTPRANVVPKASINSAPKQFRASPADAPPATIAAEVPTAPGTPFDNYKFAPIREATVGCRAPATSLPAMHAVHGSSCVFARQCLQLFKMDCPLWCMQQLQQVRMLTGRAAGMPVGMCGRLLGALLASL